MFKGDPRVAFFHGRRSGKDVDGGKIPLCPCLFQAILKFLKSQGPPVFRNRARRAMVVYSAVSIHLMTTMGDDMRKTSSFSKVVSIGAMVLGATLASSAYASSPEVVAMHATFINKANTSGDDPHLDIKIYDSNNQLVAENKDVPGQWGNSDINSVSLDLKKPFTESELASGKVVVSIKPDGKDDWKFNYNISTTYSNNAVYWQRWKGRELSQAQASLSDTLTGK